MKKTHDIGLRERALEILAAEAERLRAAAQEGCPEAFDAVTEAAYAEANDELADVIRQSLRREVAYCVPADGFWDRIVRILAFRSYAVYRAHVLADGVTDGQLRGKKSAAALKPLCRDEARFVSWMGDAYEKQKQILNNLGYWFYVLAHLAKRYGSREAGEKCLRTASAARRRADAVPIRFEDGRLEDFVSLAQDGLDALKVAADYAALADWEPFRKAEAAKFAAEERRVAARKAGA